MPTAPRYIRIGDMLTVYWGPGYPGDGRAQPIDGQQTVVCAIDGRPVSVKTYQVQATVSPEETMSL